MKQLFKLSSLQFVLLIQSIESCVYVRRSQAFPSKSLKIDFLHLTSVVSNRLEECKLSAVFFYEFSPDDKLMLKPNHD